MSLQTVSDLSDADVLENNLGLYLKPVSKIKINVQIPKLNVPGQSISTYHVMEKLKETVRPDTFIYLKSLKITATVIKFEGEMETRAACERALARLKAAGTLKINGSADSKKGADKLQVRAAHAAAAGPTRHDWEAFFRDAKGVNEMKPGERPDTVHLQDLPIKWFNENHKSHSPSGPNEKLVKLAFGGFGKIRRLEIPSKTQVDGSGGIGKTGSQHKDNFEVYIQYEEYVEFAIAMDALRGKKLLYKDSNGTVYAADIKVDFDRTKYLSEVSIRKREVEERKLKPDVEEIEKEKKEVKHVVEFPPKTITPTKDSETIPPEIIAAESQMEINTVELTPEEKRKCHLEAKLLLGVLLKRAEKTERLKEVIGKDDVDLEPLKHPKITASSERQHKNIKTTDKKEQKALENFKRKHPEDKASSLDRKELKKQKQTHSEENRISSHFEKRIKSEFSNKKHRSKSKHSSKYKEGSPKPIKNKSKEVLNSVALCDKIKKTNSLKHIEVGDLVREESMEVEKVHEDFDSASINDKFKNKSSFSDKNETSNNHKVDKNNKHYQHIVNNSKTEDHSRPDKSKKCSSPIKNKDLEVNIENEQEDEELRMLMEERKLKERLMQSYYKKQKNEEKLLEQERILKQKLVKKFKARELEKLQEKEKLRKELSGRKILKSVLADTCSSSKKY